MKNRRAALELGFLSVFTLLFFCTCAPSTTAQDNADAIAIKNSIDSKQFTFVAERMSPLRGSNRSLTLGYDVRLNRDSMVSFLPYFGRANIAVMGADGGIKFTSTQFSYSVTQSKNNRWDIEIKPSDIPDVQQFSFTIFSNGTANLHVNNISRDPISFSGRIKP